MHHIQDFKRIKTFSLKKRYNVKHMKTIEVFHNDLKLGILNQ